VPGNVLAQQPVVVAQAGRKRPDVEWSRIRLELRADAFTKMMRA
jgi:hypothetical protein